MVAAVAEGVHDGRCCGWVSGERRRRLGFSGDKALASTLMKRLTSKTFDSSKGVRAHITEMRDLIAQLKTLKIDISESFLVHFILNSLPAEYGPFKISHNTHKEEWSITELLTMCVQEEERMKHDKPKVAHLATRPKGKVRKIMGRGSIRRHPRWMAVS
ncbi:hypothetical protein CRG98_009013 [Punica granatum]|uniref:Uncharacterized protein n=1 Tax=Punica granatum TaxID=22663 RepID=A0A2I0KPT4_PUNGR|nr:hypothetical protein CRG98_009013 [Punica granatum]